MLHLRGEVDSYAADILAEYLEAVALHGDDEVVIDMSDTTSVAASAFNLLLRTHWRLVRRGGRIVVRSLDGVPSDFGDFIDLDPGHDVGQSTKADRPPLLFFTDARRQDGQVVLALHGELDISTAPHLHDTLTDLIDGQGNLAIVIDLAGLTFIGSSGIEVLVGALRRMQAHGGDIILRDPTPMAAKVFAMTGLDRAFRVIGGET